MNQEEIGLYKDKLVSLFIESEKLVNLLINGDNIQTPDDLIGENIFTYNRIPQLNVDMKTYITISINVPSTSYNDIMKNLRYTINIISRDDLMKVKGTRTNRVDLIASILDKLLNENSNFGVGKLKLMSSVEGVLEGNFPYRTLSFSVEDLNNKRC